MKNLSFNLNFFWVVSVLLKIKAKTYWWRVKGREGSGSNYGMLSAKLMNTTHQPQALWVACI